MDRELPLFEARDAHGAWSGSRTAWQRKDMLALAPHQGCERCEAVLSALWRHGHPADVAPFVVRQEARSAFELSDPEETLAAMLRRAGGLGEGRAVALVADRYAQLYAAVDLHHGEAEACARDIADWVLAAQKACAECSAMPPEEG